MNQKEKQPQFWELYLVMIREGANKTLLESLYPLANYYVNNHKMRYLIDDSAKLRVLIDFYRNVYASEREVWWLAGQGKIEDLDKANRFNPLTVGVPIQSVIRIRKSRELPEDKRVTIVLEEYEYWKRTLQPHPSFDTFIGFLAEVAYYPWELPQGIGTYLVGSPTDPIDTTLPKELESFTGAFALDKLIEMGLDYQKKVSVEELLEMPTWLMVTLLFWDTYVSTNSYQWIKDKRVLAEFDTSPIHRDIKAAHPDMIQYAQALRQISGAQGAAHWVEYLQTLHAGRGLKHLMVYFYASMIYAYLEQGK